MASEVFVKPATPVSSRTTTLSPIDQWHTRLKGCTILCFEITSQTPNQSIFRNLCDGLRFALAELPDFLGDLVPEDGDRGERGFKKLVIPEDAAVRLLCRDYTQPELSDKWTYGSYAELAKKHIPNSQLHMALLAEPRLPAATAALGPREPCFIFQASFIPGGMFLAVMNHHGSTDGIGQSHVLRTWARYTAMFSRGENPEPPVANSAVIDRSLVSKGNDSVPMEAIPFLRKGTGKPGPPPGAGSDGPPEKRIVHSIWHVSHDRLAELKAFASSPNSEDPWISSGDALSALIWRRITFARGCVDAGITRSKLLVPVNLRSRADPPLPGDYVGNAAFPTLVIDDNVQGWPSAPLYTTANEIRTTFNKFDAEAVRNYIGFFGSLERLSDVMANLDKSSNGGPDISLTHWSGLSYLSADWGKDLGKAQFMRMLAEGRRVEGLCIVHPKRDGNGGLDFMTFLQANTTEKLKEDVEFTKWCEFLCH